MSRTTRKPRWYVEHSDVSFINSDKVHNYNRETYVQKVRKTREEYERDLEEADARYWREMETEGPEILRYSWMERKYVYVPRPRPHVSRYHYIRRPYTQADFEADIERAKEERKKLTRDGSMSESGRRKYYKRLAKKEVRNEWKRMKARIMKGDDYDQFWPHDKLGKTFIWEVW